MYKCCIHILGCLLIWAIASSAQAASQQIHIDDPRFIKNPPAHILEKFTLDEDGYIIDGPRQADGEPIDYTSLISNEQMLRNFERTAFGYENIMGDRTQQSIINKADLLKKAIQIKKDTTFNIVVYIDYTPLKNDRIKNGIITQLEKIFNGGKSDKNTKYWFAAYDEDIKQIIFPEGRSFRYVDIMIYMAEPKDVEIVSKKLDDVLVKTYPDTDFYPFYQAIQQNKNVNAYHPLCYLKSGEGMLKKDRQKFTSSFIFVDARAKEDDLLECLFETVIGALGLMYDSFDNWPSMFNDDQEYKWPTSNDFSLVYLIERSELKNGMTREEVLPIVARMLYKIRPHGRNKNQIKNN